GVAGPRAPDLVMSFRWDPAGGAPGLPGCCDAADGHPGQGTHGSGSPQELRCTLVAAGPSFREGISSDLPSGHVDLTPTMLRLRGVDEAAPLAGGPPAGASRHAPPGEAPALPRGGRVVERSSKGGTARLILEEVGSTRYVAGLERDPC